MIKIVITSDSHGDTEILKKIAKNNKADYYFHCGDSQDDEYSIEPFISVKGNCDFYIKERERVFNIAGYKFLLTHGHMNFGLSLLYKAKENDIDIVLSGHTHIPHKEIVDGVLFVNPGSVSRPRGNSDASYAIMYIDENKKDNKSISKIKIEIKEI